MGGARLLIADRLQCGHSPKAVENFMTPSVLAMSCRSFNAATARRPWRTRLALARHGDPVQLQCGHSPKAVENIATSLIMYDAAVLLQCGHSPKAVENRIGQIVLPGAAVELQCGHSPKAVENADAIAECS